MLLLYYKIFLFLYVLYYDLIFLIHIELSHSVSLLITYIF